MIHVVYFLCHIERPVCSFITKANSVIRIEFGKLENILRQISSCSRGYATSTQSESWISWMLKSGPLIGLCFQITAMWILEWLGIQISSSLTDVQFLIFGVNMAWFFLTRNCQSWLDHDLMANIWEKDISILVRILIQVIVILPWLHKGQIFIQYFWFVWNN